MLNYDVIVIGGGVAGYTSALRALELGFKTAVVSVGQSAMHFSSGSIDLLSHSPLTHQPVREPLKEIKQLESSLPEHPYAKLGSEKVATALNWFKATMAQQGLPLTGLASGDNHYRITTMGTLKPTWLSQPFVKPIDYDFRQLCNIKRIIMVSIEGFRDFQPHIAQDNLARYSQFDGIEIKTVKVSLAAFGHLQRNPHDFRSIDISRILRDELEFTAFADQLLAVATLDDLIVLPAIMGNGDGLELMHKLKAYTHLQFHEVPTMPPSLLGIRIEDALMRAFVKEGGTLHKGDEVLGGEFTDRGEEQVLTRIKTKKMHELTLHAEHYICATGSFFSKGIVAKQQQVVEPMFNLDMSNVGPRSDWHQAQFFTSNTHKFLAFGVKTDKNFLPYINGRKVRNLHCAGAILSHYNPVSHGCGSGVAISTGYEAVEQIVKQLRQAKCVKNEKSQEVGV